MKRTTGVCYYPEHWPESIWAEDAARMAQAGLTWVRIGEFAWSRIEPTPGDVQFDWLDRAVETLAKAGLRVVMGTPTATPPRWMIDKHPDMLAVDANGHARRFGSRRHYCFSHPGYLKECQRIVTLMAEHYGANPAVQAWQTDNEYGCHDTTLSYSPAAREAFQLWAAQQYQSIDALNRAWGNIFWSMEYSSFDQIDLPNLTVTEPNPSHVQAFRRFSSDQVVAFNKAQTDILHKFTDAPLIHNYMGRVLDFDHFAMGADLDIASWDSYPLGFLSDRMDADRSHKLRYLHQGDPDFQAFHHDLYRAVGAARGKESAATGRWWVMEQQPGPVNWAPVNPAPLPGMARLWAWEAFAHGAEAVCYFRWRQAPFAQEQMHAGLLRPDSAPAAGLAEAAQVGRELAELPNVDPQRAPVAIIFDYASQWAWETQPQGKGFDYFALVFSAYRALRRAGLSVDILQADGAEMEHYSVVLAPGLLSISDALQARINKHEGQIILGPRTNSKTPEMAIPVPLPPAIAGFDVEISHVETLPSDAPVAVHGGGAFQIWAEALEGRADVSLEREDGKPAMMSRGGLSYLGGWPDDQLWDRIIKAACTAQNVETFDLPEGLRLRENRSHRFAFNYAPEPVTWEGHHIAAADLIWLPK